MKKKVLRHVSVRVDGDQWDRLKKRYVDLDERIRLYLDALDKDLIELVPARIKLRGAK